jgi:hypothetical protein
MPPPTLFEYLPKDALLFVDESHVMVPQVRAMYNGDRARKTSLVEYGFRLPSALDNRPLKFEEWLNLRPQTIFVSATPAPFELEQTGGEIVELIIRPTGLLDPVCVVRPASTQVEDLAGEIKKTVEQGFRVLVTTLTKKMAEDLSNYLSELGQKVSYLHSAIQTLERIEIIRSLRLGEIDVIVGLTDIRKETLKQDGREYALSCSWENRFTQWLSVLELNTKPKWYFYCSLNFQEKMVQQYIDNLNIIYKVVDSVADADIAMNDLGLPGGLRAVAESCLVVDSLGTSIRKGLLEEFVQMQLVPYENLFGVGKL